MFTLIERIVEQLSPSQVITLFLSPFAVSVPALKLSELWLFCHGHIFSGFAVLIAAKIIGVTFAARVFAIAKPKMLQVRWFAHCHDLAMSWLGRCHKYLLRSRHYKWLAEAYTESKSSLGKSFLTPKAIAVPTTRKSPETP